MSTLRSDVCYGRKEINVSYPAARESILTSPVILGASEPVTPTFSFTIGSADLPTIDANPIEMRYLAMIYASGRNTDVSTNRNLCYRLKLNSTSVVTATNLVCDANKYWTACFRIPSLNNMVVGDVVAVYLWNNTANALNYNWHGMSLVISRIFTEGINKRLLLNTRITFDLLLTGLFSLGNSPAYSNAVQGYNQYAFYDNTDYMSVVSHYPSWGRYNYLHRTTRQHATYGWFRFTEGDISSSVITSSDAIKQPYWVVPPRLCKIEYTPTAVMI